ncbi:MAG: hypothetical protein QM785_14640 [Pyrinomonadaceae bacterium]
MIDRSRGCTHGQVSEMFRVASRRLNDLTLRFHAVAAATLGIMYSVPWVVTHGYIHGIATRWKPAEYLVFEDLF